MANDASHDADAGQVERAAGSVDGDAGIQPAAVERIVENQRRHYAAGATAAAARSEDDASAGRGAGQASRAGRQGGSRSEKGGARPTASRGEICARARKNGQRVGGG